MRTSVAISSVGHAAILAWSLVAFAANPDTPKPADSMPVDIVSESELSQLTAGVRKPPKLDLELPKPKPLVEQVAPPKPVDDPTPKIAAREIKAATEAPAAPAPPAPKPPAPAQKKPPEPKRDLIAEALKKDEAKKPDSKPEPKTEPKQTESKPQPAPKAQPMFDPRQLQALLDKRAPQRVAAAGDIRNDDVSLGAASGGAAQLSQSEIDALRRRLEECWNPPAGVNATVKLNVVIRVLFNTDGSVAKSPDVVSGSASPLGPAMAESAKRAVLRCQPFKMLKPEHYEQWKDIEINFDPQQMLRG
jgi:outer membrane biosynthesis protein TonB